MAKLLYIMNTSVDGYVAERDGKFDWSVPTAELFALFNELLRPVGTYLYGRRLYETMAVWDAAHLEPGTTAFSPGLLELEREFAQAWRAADKIVFSSALTEASTSRTRIERAFDADQIRRFKATSERDITVGGPHLAAQMIAANLIDEFHVLVHPIIVGGGNYWLPRDVRIPLELVSESRLGRVVYMKYRRA